METRDTLVRVENELEEMRVIKKARVEDGAELTYIKDEFKKDRVRNDKTTTDLYTLENYTERYMPMVFIRLL